MVERLFEWATERGYRVAWGPAAVVAEALDEVRKRGEAAELDGGFYAAELASMVDGGRVPAADAVVVVAIPRPAHRVSFELAEGPFAALLPPTYVRYRALYEDVRQDLARHGLPGARVEHLTAPLKAVAARLGLVRYGRNNLAYADGLGSYVQLCGFVTDAGLPLDRTAGGRRPALLDECAGCGVCAAVCPTGAIDDERVLLSAHRCLTWVNESPGEWPGWAPGWAHTCLLGCLECQKVCPANPPLAVEETGVTFSAAETGELLAPPADRRGNVADGIRTKLAWLGQPSAEAVLGRNLRALLDAGTRGGTPSTA